MPAPRVWFMLSILIAGCISPINACWSCQTPLTSKESTMNDDIQDSFSRIGVPDVPAVEFEGKRYAQIDNGENEHLDQRTGYLAVTDTSTNQRLKTIKVYDVAFDRDLEADVQDVFFIRLELQAEKRRLLIENEHGRCFWVDVDNGTVTPAQ